MNFIVRLAILASLAIRVEADEIPVFVVAGQSNAVGAGTDAAALSDALKPAQPNVLFQGQLYPIRWRQLEPPTHGTNSFGPELTVGKTISDALGGKQVAVVKFACSGTNLYDQWNPDAGTSLYCGMQKIVKEALETLPNQQSGTTGRIAGFFWMQGESDAWAGRTTEQYEHDLRNLIKHVRADFGDPSLPFVFGLIYPDAGTASIRQAQRNVAASVPSTSLVDTDSCSRVNVHFDTKGTVDLGIGFAKGYLSIASEASPNVDLPRSKTTDVRPGVSLYVSKLGDNTDGLTWKTAFRTIQAALSAVPNDRGGHRVIVRPDTYSEANLFPAHKGAAGAYNRLVGDVDGQLGSGAKGWVVIDSSCPGVAVRRGNRDGWFEIIKSDLPETGFKCVDWYVTLRCDGDMSSIVWDRWALQHLYATGSDGGLGFDMARGKDLGSEFSAIVEDCVGIGRFAGGYAAGHVARKSEPVLFRRSYFMNLDWWGDAGGAYARAQHSAMPDFPDVVFDDCTLVGPDNALQVAYPGCTQYSRVALKDCRLITLNFSQPHGMPSSGIISCDADAKFVHVDIEDCSLMGYKVFGKSALATNKVEGTGTGLVFYATKGRVQAYVQFEQAVPEGIERLGHWPVELLERIQPPKAGSWQAKGK
jgi:hypothetical protein